MRVEFPADAEVRPGRELRFHVLVEDDERDAVTLRLLNPPPGLVFPTRHALPTPAKVEVCWRVPLEYSARVPLHFRAEDQRGRGRADLVATPRAIRSSGTRIGLGDVTGDGVSDVVGVASQADSSNLVNVGFIHVWAGATLPSGTPTATLELFPAVTNDQLGLGSDQDIQLVDLVGSSALDVVAVAKLADEGAVDSGGIYVWEGGATIGGPPTYELKPIVSALGDQLGSAPLLFEDVTGDGRIDLIAPCPDSDHSGVNSGAVYVWAGGTTLTTNPTAALGSGGPGDQIGRASGGGVQVGDLTGDGIADIVVAAPLADSTAPNIGRISVWSGGPSLSGSPSPIGEFSGSSAGDQLGNASGQAVVLADVTGDGTTDLLAASSSADNGPSTRNVGVVFVVEGGPAFPSSLGTLRDSSASTNDQLGSSAGQALQVADLDDDGILDVVVGAQYADVGGLRDRGAIYVWDGGGALLFNPSPTRLDYPGSTNDQLGLCAGQGIQLADVTGDGRLDVVAGAMLADTSSGTVDAGAAVVWVGDPQITANGQYSSLPPFFASSPQADDRLGFVAGQGLELVDLTGDGTLDLVAGAQLADRAGVVDSGAVFVWRGGPTLVSAPTLFTLSVTGAAVGDRLGQAVGQGLWFDDVTGDGLIDLVAGASEADVAGVADAGAVYVWKGAANPSSAPTATLRALAPVAGDQVGSASGLGVQLADVTDDGVLDIVAGARYADVAGVVNAGAVHVWRGSSSLSGNVNPFATLSVPGAIAGDQLGFASMGIQLEDVTGDGVSDLVVGAERADVGEVNTGAIYLWKGGSTGLSGLDVTLSVVGAFAGDRLGF
jgi:hypothetical protein